MLDAIDVEAGPTQVTFDSVALAQMIRKPGAKPEDKGAEQTIEGGRSVIVFLELNLGKANAPTSIAHVLHVADDKGKPHEVVLKQLAVSAERPSVVAPPLRGEWIAGDWVHNAWQERSPSLSTLGVPLELAALFGRCREECLP